MNNNVVLTHCIAGYYGANILAFSDACYLRNKGLSPEVFLGGSCK